LSFSYSIKTQNQKIFNIQEYYNAAGMPNNGIPKKQGRSKKP
jgi:hypothetical protein